MAVVPEQGHGAGDGCGGEDFPAADHSTPSGEERPPYVQVRADDWVETQQLVTAARDLVRAVRACGAAPGALTPLLQELSRKCGMGPLW